MAIRKIVIVGDDILRKKSRKVEKIDGRIRMLAEDMADTLHASGNGVGLAAPQVGILKRIFIIDIGDGVKIFINPEIIATSGSRDVMESCLSVPNRNGVVERPEKVTIKATDENGKEFTMTAGGLLGQCICHENDHLDGILFIDKIKRNS